MGAERCKEFKENYSILGYSIIDDHLTMYVPTDLNVLYTLVVRSSDQDQLYYNPFDPWLMQ